MGFDKQFLELNEKRLILTLIENLKGEFNEFIIVTNKPERYRNFPYKILTDKIKDKGPLGGIHSGLSEASSKYSFVIACDMPNINIEYIRYMKTCLKNSNYDGCITKSEKWIEPFSSFYSKSLVKDMEKILLEGEKMIYPFLKRQNIFYIEEKIARNYSPNWEIFVNLNTQEELEKYLGK